MQAVTYRLSELVERFSAERVVKPAAWVKHLFESLDWGNRFAFAISPMNGSGYSLLVDNLPMVNILADSPDNIDNVYRALNRTALLPLPVAPMS
jgi:hypothetical protein